jgi:hypothetical protein
MENDELPLSEICVFLSQYPGLAASLNMKMIMNFIRMAARLKCDIIHAQPPSFHADLIPNSLPHHIASFLSSAVDLRLDFVEGCWAVFKRPYGSTQIPATSKSVIRPSTIMVPITDSLHSNSTLQSLIAQTQCVVKTNINYLERINLIALFYLCWLKVLEAPFTFIYTAIVSLLFLPRIRFN